MDPDNVFDRLNEPPVPLEQLHQQSLKNRAYARAVLEGLPDEVASPLREELAELTRQFAAAYEAGDAVEHYRLDRHLMFQFMMKLSFTLQMHER